MRGWFKLIETIRKTDPPSNELIKSSPNSSTTNTNGHISKSPDINHIDSLLPESPHRIYSPSVITSASTPIRLLDDLPATTVEPIPKTTGYFLNKSFEQKK